jgi:hypothetical protein
MILPPGSIAMTGWTVGGAGGAVGLQNGVVDGVGPVSGSQHIAFNGGNTAPGTTISQTFGTVIGQTYSVHFNVGRKGSGAGMMSILAAVTSTTGQTLGFSSVAAPDTSGYGAAHTVTFIATTSSSSLTFTDTSSTTVAVDLLLDNVRLEATSRSCITAPSELISWWPGNGDATDLMNKNPGEINGATFADGMVGQAFSFNGTNSQITFGNSIGNFGTNDFTIDFWIRTTSTRLESVMEKWPICGLSSMWYVRMNGSPNPGAAGRLVLEMSSDTLGNDRTILVGQRPVNDGVFHHVAVVRKGRTTSFLIDGVLDGSSDSSGGVTRIENSANFTVGRSVCVGVDGTEPFTGQMDEIDVFGRALSSEEIAAIFQAEGAGKCLLPTIHPLTAFTNGSFELPNLLAGVGQVLPPGSTAITGWTVGGASPVSWQVGSVDGVSPVDGMQHLAFNGGNAIPGGTISQTFLTAVGQAYLVHFSVGRKGTGAGTMKILAEVRSGQGEVLGTLTANAPETPGYGAPQSIAFTATTTNCTLSFADISTSTVAVDVLLDNVRVEASAARCVEVPDGLISWWPAEGNAVDMIGGNNGSLRGNADYGDGKVGHAFTFDGNGDGILVGNPASLRLQNFTIEGWIQRGSAAQVSASSIYGEIVGYGWGGYVFGFLTDGRLFLSKNGISHVDSARPIADTVWHHVGVIKSGGSVVFYIDGTAEAPRTYDVTFEFSTDLVIGAVNGTIDASFLGSIDELSIYRRPLTGSEIQSVYLAGASGKCPPPPGPSGLLAHWKFDEAAGSVAHDSVGSFDGNLSTGGASFVSGGVSGGALSLNKAGNGFVNMGDILGLAHTDFSVSAWIKMAPGDRSNTVILSKHAAYSRNGYLLDVNKLEVFRDDKASFVEGGDGVASYTIDETPISTTSVNDGNWHQVAAVYHDGGTRSIYVDGAPAEDSKPSQPFNQNSVAFLVGGANYDGVPTGVFDGLIDDVQIYNRALVDSDVEFLFQNPGHEISGALPVEWDLTTMAGPGGTIARDPNLLHYTNGTTVTLTAVPGTGFTFAGWSGDVTGDTNPVSLSMNGNTTVTASFREVPARVLAVVNPDPSQEGTRIRVPITLTSQGDVGGMSFILRYDPVYLREPDLEWLSAVGSALNQVSYDTPGRVRATFALPATAVPAGTQVVAQVTFRARSVPFSLSTDLGLEIVDASKPTGDPITSGSFAQPGAARILFRRVLGDNNANDRLDVGDASIIQRFLTGLEAARSWDVTGNDLNANTRLDSGDVIKVLRAVVGLDPQPQPAGSVTGAATLSGAGIAKAGGTSESATLSLDRERAQPGDLVTAQVRLQGITTALSGASFTLDYPTDALRLVNAQSERTGVLVPAATAVTVWNVKPAQNDFALQSGTVLAAVSSPTVWPTNNGVLAEFTFQVQAGEPARYRWPIHLGAVEISDTGYEIRTLADSTAYFLGRDPVPPSLGATSAALTQDGLSLTLACDAGLSYTLEVSTDLHTWTALTSLKATSETLTFVDPDAKTSERRFYRAVQQAAVVSQPQ